MFVFLIKTIWKPALVRSWKPVIMSDQKAWSWRNKRSMENTKLLPSEPFIRYVIKCIQSVEISVVLSCVPDCVGSLCVHYNFIFF